MSCRHLLIAALSAAVMSTPVLGQTQSLSGDDWLTLQLHSVARADRPFDDIRKGLQRVFTNSDINGGGVSKSDYELRVQLQMARHRAGILNTWMQRDLNGDGTVTRAELQSFFSQQANRPIRSSGVTITPTEDQVRQMLTKLIDQAMTIDANNDESVTFDELRASAQQDIEKRGARYHSTRGLVPLTLDADGDNTVSAEEYSRAVNRALGSTDLDGDGNFSQQEITELRTRTNELRKIERAETTARRNLVQIQTLAKACGFPAPPKGALTVLLGTFGGEAWSTASVGGDAEAITVANVWIEPGTQPLYVALATHSAMIWQFSGSVDRVAQVVAGSSRMIASGIPRTGVVGVTPDRIHFAPKKECLPFFRDPTRNAAKTRSILKVAIGLNPDLVIGRGQVSAVSLPSGVFDRQPVYDKTMDLPTSGPAKELWAEVQRNRPGGIVRVDPAAVVSRAPVKPYDVLPGRAGLAQLVERGALEITGKQHIVRVNGGPQIILGGGPDTVVLPEGKGVSIANVPSRFRILKKLRIPADLSGSSSASFVLGRGVPKPEGITAQSCVIDETTAKPIPPSRSCR